MQADTHVEDIPELVYERKEIEEIKNRVTGYFNGSEGAFVRLLSGPSGSGKTLSVLYILYTFIKQNPHFSKDFVYINGTQVRAPKSMFNYLARQLGAIIKESNNSMSSLAESIEHTLNESQRRKLVIIDEVDKIYKNSRESP
ncbi:MAG: ATP-binding protein, partial [Nanoarchaeota archaeon]